jgi:hypothetical protein
MSKSLSDQLLEEFTRGYAFNESLREELSYRQMIALADMFIGWAGHEETEPMRSAWLTGFAEGLLAEADLVGPEWSPPEPEKLTIIGFMGRLANGDRVRSSQTPRGRMELGLDD